MLPLRRQLAVQLLALVLLLRASLALGSGCTRRFRSLSDTSSCLVDSLAVAQRSNVPDSLSCLIAVSNIAQLQCDLCVVQYSQRTLQCSVFSLQDVCAQVFPAVSRASPGVPLPTCETYVDTAALELRQLFDGVWVPSVRAEPGLRNVVCRDGVQNNFAGVNVAYDESSSAAQLNGADAYLNLADAGDFHWRRGLAWLLRIKRVPKSQPYLDYYNCENGAMGADMWEWEGPGTLHYNSYGTLLPAVKVETRFNRQLVVETHVQWVDLGVTVSNITGEAFMYYKRDFINRAYFNYSSGGDVGAPHKRCIRFGASDRTYNYWFKGQVKVIALANEYRSAADINWLFDLFQ